MLFPVFDSISFLAIPATFPPSFATFLFSVKLSGFLSFEISVVDASASIFRTSSRLVMLSLRFCFLRPLYFLYSFTLLSAHALVISYPHTTTLRVTVVSGQAPSLAYRQFTLSGKYGELYPLFYPSLLPFIGQFFSDFYAFESLVDPLFGVAFFEVGLHGSFKG